MWVEINQEPTIGKTNDILSTKSPKISLNTPEAKNTKPRDANLVNKAKQPNPHHKQSKVGLIRTKRPLKQIYYCYGIHSVALPMLFPTTCTHYMLGHAFCTRFLCYFPWHIPLIPLLFHLFPVSIIVIFVISYNISGCFYSYSSTRIFIIHLVHMLLFTPLFLYATLFHT